MKILFVSHSAGAAGAEQSLVHLVREAVDRGHHGRIALPAEGPLIDLLTPYADKFPITVLRSRLWMGRRYNIPVGIVRLIQAFRDLPGYRRLLTVHNFDAVVVNSSVAPVPLLAGFTQGVPTLLIIRESFMTNPMLKSLIPKRVIRMLLAKWATDVVTISKFVAAQYASKSTIIYPQVSQQFLRIRPEDVHDAPTWTLRAVMFGTISPEKGQIDAVKAVGLARAKGTAITLDLFGHGSETDLKSVRSTIEDLGLADAVKLRGPTSDVVGAYRAADFSIVCSRNEAFGKVTAESVLVGRPVVAFGCGATPEILLQGGGICTDPNPEALSIALTALADHKDLLSQLRREASMSPIRSVLVTSAGDVLNRIEMLKPF